jgi:8-oxo-dGTP pyrophosphatase MutT (NUDIX family)
MIEVQRMTKRREGSLAVLLDTEGRFLLQVRDNIPHIRDPGKISLFGGSREGDESFLDCVVREVHEEIGHYLPPGRFEPIGQMLGHDYAFPGDTMHCEIFLARGVPAEALTITEGTLRIVARDELKDLWGSLSLPAQHAIDMILRAVML